MKQFFICLIFLLTSTNSNAQKKFVIDSLHLQLESSHSNKNKANILIQLSDQYQNSDFNKSFKYANKALLIATENNFPQLIAKSYKKTGDLLLKKGVYSKAMNNYLQAKTIYEKEQDTIALVSIEHNIGIIYYRLNKFDKALNHYRNSLAQQNKILHSGDSSFYNQLHVFYTSIGSCYQEKGELESAKNYFYKAVLSANKNNDYYNLGVIHNNLGKILMQQKQYAQAKINLQKALAYREKINDQSGIARSHLFLAEFYRQQHQLKKALNECEMSVEISSKLGNMFSITEGYALLSTIYEGLGDVKKAFRNYKKYHQYNDSLIQEASISKVTKLQMQYELDKKEQKRILKEQHKDMIFYFVIVLLFLGICIITLFYGLIKSRAKRIKQEKYNLEQRLILKNKDLEVKSKELTTNVIYLLKKNELISNISERLLRLKSQLKQENKQPIQKIIFELQASVDHDVWKEFELRFQQVHNNFYNLLQQRYPELTPTEIKLCAFLRLNMTSKEISAITHQNVKSIEVARSRIRKKLNLTGTDTNLVLFLGKIE